VDKKRKNRKIEVYTILTLWLSSRMTTITKIENVESLTEIVFSDILRHNWIKQQDSNCSDNSETYHNNIPKITGISKVKVDQGVLSDVYRVHLEYEYAITNVNGNILASSVEEESISPTVSSTTDVSPPTAFCLYSSEKDEDALIPADWLVKLCRPDLDLCWMIQNENIFYSRIVSSMNAETSCFARLPFTLPKFLCGSDQHLILQEVIDVQTHPLSEGCPSDKINFLLRCMAALHAACWESKVLLLSLNSNNNIDVEDRSSCDSLIFPAGMGQRLPPLQKEGLFISSWQETIGHLRLRKELDTKQLDFITTLSQKLSSLKLRDIHEMVHQHRVTCVHGDYHIANWLFPISGNRKPVLIDFATTGFDNPMIDFVFFLVASTNDTTVSNTPLFLEKYYQLLIEYDPNLTSKITLATLQEWLPWTLLCQFMILVAYDRKCRNIAKAEQDDTKRENQIQHFCNVNRRIVLAMSSIENWETILSKIEATTNKERIEVQLHCQHTPLVI